MSEHKRTQFHEVTIPIEGMHCASCEVMISESLAALPGVTEASAKLKSKSARVVSTRPLSYATLENAVQEAGYKIGTEERPLLAREERIYKDIAIGLLVVIAIAIVYSMTDVSRLADTAVSGAGSGLIGLLMGVTAGFSTCMALIGGLVLGVASRHAERHPTATPMQKFRPHLYFNGGRIISFVILGGIIGAVGGAFQLSGSVIGLLTLAVGFFMLMLGLQLTEAFPRLKSGLTLPSGLARRLGLHKRGTREYSHCNAMLMGGATFFLPCGFTQAMQLYAVSTGSFTEGALVMGAFALGTAPGLLSLGGLTSAVKGTFAKRFFRIVGVAVVAMALINLNNGLNLTGFKRFAADFSMPSFSRNAADDTPPEVILTSTYTLTEDMIPRTFEAQVGKKTQMVIDVKENGQGCMSTVMIPGLDDKPQYLQAGKKLTLTFTPEKAGVYQITCAMGIPRGALTVTE